MTAKFQYYLLFLFHDLSLLFYFVSISSFIILQQQQQQQKENEEIKFSTASMWYCQCLIYLSTFCDYVFPFCPSVPSPPLNSTIYQYFNFFRAFFVFVCWMLGFYKRNNIKIWNEINFIKKKVGVFYFFFFFFLLGSLSFFFCGWIHISRLLVFASYSINV